MPCALLAVSWSVIDWTDEGSGEYAGGIVLRDASGDVMRVSLGPGDTDCRPFYRADPEDWIVKALVAAEDGAFWEHRGVRPFSILRAAFQNLVCLRRVSGASTITMQAVRLISPHPKSLAWKFVEAVKALKMERRKDKLWILSQYLNRAPYGSNFVGIEAAARGWFGKDAKELGIGEAAMLAGMVQAPSRFRPDRGYERATRRREYVLDRMQALGYITEEQRRDALTVKPVVCRSPRPFRHPYYCDWYLSELLSRGTGTAGDVRELGRTSGDFVTPLDPDIQEFCEKAVEDAEREGGYSSAAVVMRVSDGAVVALACSGNYFDAAGGQVNTAVAPRPAGSTLKPFLTALAIDRGVVAPDTVMADVPLAFNGYRPANFDGKYRGAVTVRDALVMSLNIPFVSMLDRIGVSEFGKTLRMLGFRHVTAGDETYGLGMAIGNVEVSLVELVRAYGTVARGGERVFSRWAAYQVSDVLSGDERSQAAFGHIADVELPRFAWKTGTSSAYRDAWTAAWNPEYVIGVWCGHMQGGFGDEKLVGSRASAPVCWKIARHLYPRNDGPWFTEPEDAARRNRRVKGVAVSRELAISKPDDDAVFRLVPGMRQQRVICEVLGNPAGRRLWWFADGKPVGESEGAEPFAFVMEKGRHDLVCAAADGDSSSVSFRVVGEDRVSSD